MISGILIRRLLLQTLMWPVLVIKIDPVLGSIQLCCFPGEAHRLQ
jgi:hypothetical protein